MHEVAKGDKACERQHPVPHRRLGFLPLAEEEGQRPAVAAAAALADAEADDPRADDLLVAAIDADIQRLLRAEAELLEVGPVEVYDGEWSAQEGH